MPKITKSAAIALAVLVSHTAGASQISIDFEGLVHGEVLNSQIAGVTISAVNQGGGPDLAVAFDSNLSGTRDPDLEGPNWSGGNIVSGTDLGNLLILQENNIGTGDGVADRPDDEGSRPAGSITLAFDTAYSSFGFDLIDIEGTRPSDEPGDLDLYLGDALVYSVSFMDFLADPSVQYGDNSANRISPLSGFGLFDRAVFNLGGSGAIDNIVATVPAPAPLALLGLALVGFGVGSRSRSR